MGKITRHEDVTLRIFVDGIEHGPHHFTDFSYEAMTPADSAKYQGDSIPRKDASFQGYRISGTAHLVESDLNEVEDAYLDGVKNRTDTGRIQIVMSYTHPKTKARKAMRFENVQGFTVSTSTSDGQRVRQMISGEAEDGRPIQ